MTTFLDRLSKTFIGIEFNDKTIIVTCLKNSFSGVRLLSSSAFPLKEDAEVTAEINSLISRYTKDTRNVFVSIPIEWSIIKSIDVPSTKSISEQTLSQMMRFEIERHIPYQLEDVFYDYQVVGKSENACTVLFVIVHKDKINYVKEFLGRLSLQPILITISSLAILNAIEFSDTTVGGWQELLDITKKTDIFNRKWKVCVSLFVSENYAHFAILKNGFCFYVKSSTLNLTEPPDVLIDNISSEIKLLFHDIYEEKPDILIISGQIDSLPDIQNALNTKLGVNVQIVDPIAKLFKTKREADIYKFVPSIGACYTGFGAGTSSINLLPHKTDSKIMKLGSSISRITISLILIFIIGIFTGEIINNKRSLMKIEEELKKNEPTIGIINNLSTNLKTFEQKKTFLSYIREYNIFLDVLSELSTIIPSDAWLTNLNYKEISDEKNPNFKGELIINGQAKSSSMLISILENSPYFENVEFMGPITKKNESEGFKIKAIVVKPEESAKGQSQAKTKDVAKGDKTL